MVMGLLCLLIFRIWSIDALIGSNTGGVFLAIILYGLSVIPFNYMASFFFEESTSAQNSMLLFYIFVGALVLIATIVLSIISSTKAAAWHIKFVCRLVPSYCFGECIANIIVRTSVTAFGTSRELFDMEVVGTSMIHGAAAGAGESRGSELLLSFVPLISPFCSGTCFFLSRLPDDLHDLGDLRLQLHRAGLREDPSYPEPLRHDIWKP